MLSIAESTTKKRFMTATGVSDIKICDIFCLASLLSSIKCSLLVAREFLRAKNSCCVDTSIASSRIEYSVSSLKSVAGLSDFIFDC